LKNPWHVTYGDYVHVRKQIYILFRALLIKFLR
jgi:hypothetical protein